MTDVFLWTFYYGRNFPCVSNVLPSSDFWSGWIQRLVLERNTGNQKDIEPFLVLQFSWTQNINLLKVGVALTTPWGVIKTFSSLSMPQRKQRSFIWPDSAYLCGEGAESEWERPHPRGEQENSDCSQKGIAGPSFSEILIEEATGSSYLVDIGCHYEINNSQSLGSTFPWRAACREQQKCWQNPEGRILTRSGDLCFSKYSESPVTPSLLWLTHRKTGILEGFLALFAGVKVSSVT